MFSQVNKHLKEDFMKFLVEYKLHNGHVPHFIDDGGYFVTSGTYIGVSVDDENYIPDTMMIYIKINLQDRLKGIDMYDENNKLLTTTQKNTLVDNFFIEKELYKNITGAETEKINKRKKILIKKQKYFIDEELYRNIKFKSLIK